MSSYWQWSCSSLGTLAQATSPAAPTTTRRGRSRGPARGDRARGGRRPPLGARRSGDRCGREPRQHGDREHGGNDGSLHVATATLHGGEERGTRGLGHGGRVVLRDVTKKYVAMSMPDVAAIASVHRSESGRARGINSGNAASRNRGIDTGLLPRTAEPIATDTYTTMTPGARQRTRSQRPTPSPPTTDARIAHEERQPRVAEVTERGPHVRQADIDAVPPPRGPPPRRTRGPLRAGVHR